MVQANPDPREKKNLYWIGNSREEFLKFPMPVKEDMGSSLGAAQFGEKAADAKPWRGEGPGVFEIVDQHAGNAYRAVYAASFETAVYVLHAFQKKSPDGGSQTDQRDVQAVKMALKSARDHYKAS